MTDIEAAARQTLALLDYLKLEPTPENYRLAFAHFMGFSADLSRELREHLKKNGKLTQTQAYVLYARYLQGHPEGSSIIGTSKRMQELLNVLQVHLGSANHATAGYGSTLDEAKSRLNACETRSDLSALVDELVAETERMHRQTVQLENHLVESSTKIADLRRSLKAAQMAAMTDALTGLANRKQLDVLIETIASDEREHALPAVLVLADVDHFKKFNDEHGHSLGDDVLRLVASILKQNVAPRNLVARYGGEEFAIILTQTTLPNAFQIADTLRTLVSSRQLHLRRSGASFGRITMSLGVSDLHSGECGRSWLERADRALYQAKHGGRNRVVALPALG